jgi:hypothetical protein
MKQSPYGMTFLVRRELSIVSQQEVIDAGWELLFLFSLLLSSSTASLPPVERDNKKKTNVIQKNHNTTWFVDLFSFVRVKLWVYRFTPSTCRSRYKSWCLLFGPLQLLVSSPYATHRWKYNGETTLHFFIDCIGRCSWPWPLSGDQARWLPCASNPNSIQPRTGNKVSNFRNTLCLVLKNTNLGIENLNVNFHSSFLPVGTSPAAISQLLRRILDVL